MPVDAFVFYAREDLEIGSGYGTAIQGRGGPSIKRELDEIGSIEMGQAVITGAGDMNARHIVHACGPKFQEPDLERKLRDCVNSALRVAAEARVRTLAFPPMGAGFYGISLDMSAKVMLECFRSFFERASSIEEVIICVVDYRDYAPFKNVLEKTK